MRTKSKKPQNKCINPNDLRPVFDLFGEIPVTNDEIIAWCEAVPKISRHTWRLEWYAKTWGVADKIRQAKLTGRYDDLINAPHQYKDLRFL